MGPTVSCASGAWVLPSDGTTVTGVGPEAGARGIGPEQWQSRSEHEDHAGDDQDGQQRGLPGWNRNLGSGSMDQPDWVGPLRPNAVCRGFASHRAYCGVMCSESRMVM